MIRKHSGKKSKQKTLNAFYKVYEIESLKDLATLLERNTQNVPKLISFIIVLLMNF